MTRTTICATAILSLLVSLIPIADADAAAPTIWKKNSAVRGTCQAIVAGKALMNGPCSGLGHGESVFVTAEKDGCSIEIRRTANGFFGRIFAYKDVCGTLNTNADLGSFGFDGECWKSVSAKVCLAANSEDVPSKTQTSAKKFYYKPGDRVPFWYLDKSEDTVIAVQATITDIIGPDSDDVEMLVKGCTKQVQVNDGEPGVSEPCMNPADATKNLLPMATANCQTGVFRALSGIHYAFRGKRDDRNVQASHPPYLFKDSAGAILPNGPRYWATLEQFKAMCPAFFIKNE